jgi:RND family efflux transporter MFP subunit
VDPVEFESRWQQAREQAESAKSQLEIAQRQFDTNQALVAQGFIAKVALENSLATLRGAQASYQAAQAGAAVARKALDDSLLRAPFAGVVASRLAQAGERVALDAKILELVDPGKLEVEVALSAADSVDVRVGQQATLRVEGRAQAIQARVKRVSPSAQAATRSVLAFLELPAQEGLRHGLFVEGSLELRRLQTLAVPLTAVRTDRPQPYVQWVQENQDLWRVAYAPVQLGPRGRLAGSESDEAWVAVQGVSAGQQILRGEVGGLREGLRVRAVTPAAAGATGSASTASAAR